MFALRQCFHIAVRPPKQNHNPPLSAFPYFATRGPCAQSVVPRIQQCKHLTVLCAVGGLKAAISPIRNFRFLPSAHGTIAKTDSKGTQTAARGPDATPQEIIILQSLLLFFYAGVGTV